MTEKFRPESDVWDRFLSLLYPCDDSMTIEEIDADLERAGIDFDSAYQRVQKMIATQRARARMISAKKTRQSLGDRVRDVAAPKMENLRDSVRRLIGTSSTGQQQMAYFHKLQDAASEDDLQSLLDDLEKLATLREMADDS